MFDRHPKGDLSAYHEHQLSPEREKWVAAHLSRCQRCRADLEEIAFGARLVQQLPRTAAPESLYRSVENALADARSRPRPPKRAPLRLWPQAAALVGLAGFLALGWYFVVREPLSVAVARSPPTALEARAVAEHAKQVNGALAWELTTSDGRQLQQWLLARSGLFAHLPDKRPQEDAQHFHLIGATLLSVGQISAAAIGYQMDGAPVTLVTAKLSQVPDAPPEARFSKKVFYRSEPASGVHVLTWSTEGQAYVMVSSLARFGEQGCFLCHTTADRRQLISKMNPR